VIVASRGAFGAGDANAGDAPFDFSHVSAVSGFGVVAFALEAGE